MTLRFVTITEEAYFPYQQAINVSDVLLKIMMDTWKGHGPDVETLVGAWAATSMYWVE